MNWLNTVIVFIAATFSSWFGGAHSSVISTTTVPVAVEISTSTQNVIFVSLDTNSRAGIPFTEGVTVFQYAQTETPLGVFDLESKGGASVLHSITFVVDTGSTTPGNAVLTSLFSGITMVDESGQSHKGVLSLGGCDSKQCGPSGGNPVVVFNNLNVSLPANSIIQIILHATIPPDTNGSFNNQIMQLYLPGSEAMVSATDAKGVPARPGFTNVIGNQITLHDNVATTSISSSSNVSVSGMSQYTDSNFGFSFWYPSSWTVTQDTVTSPDQNGWFQGGSIVKELNVHGGQLSTGVTIQEFQSPGFSITELGQTKSANPVGVDQKYFFDPSTHTWMYENLTTTPSGSRAAGTITAANVSNNTMGGLHVFSGAKRFGSENIIPLSTRNFLVVFSNDPTSPDQIYFVNTVTATDPSVATPVSASVQMQTIQKESVLYGAVGTSLQNGQWYTDSNYVYDSAGDILPGANPATFMPLGLLGSQIGTDGVNVYWRSILISGADPKTFTVVGNGIEKDKSHVYMEEQLIPGADPLTFTMTEIATARDAYHTYDWSNNNLKIDGVSTSVNLH